MYSLLIQTRSKFSPKLSEQITPLPLLFPLALVSDKFQGERNRPQYAGKKKKKERKEGKEGNVKRRTALTGRSYS